MLQQQYFGYMYHIIQITECTNLATIAVVYMHRELDIFLVNIGIGVKMINVF